MIDMFNEDCFVFLKKIQNNSVDLILIDPPYNISKKSGFHYSRKKKPLFPYLTDFGEWDKKENYLDECLKELYRVLKKSGTIICFYDIWKITYLKKWMENVGFKQVRLVIYQKTNPVPINSKVNYLANSREIALTGVKGNNPVFHSEYDNGVYSFPINSEDDRFHSTQKPVRLIKELIIKHSNEGDLILDCFAGSFTTAIACIETNRNFIGCEIDIDYFEKSLKRVNDQNTQLKLF